MGTLTSTARLLMVENNRQSPISFALGENSAQEFICFAHCRSSVRFISLIRQTDMLINYRCVLLNGDLPNLPPNSFRTLADRNEKRCTRD